MIQIVQGDLLAANTEALVNTVNTVGVMGKGIALQFKQAFPKNYSAYRKACKSGEVKPGKMFVFFLGELANPKYIINFPTKRHWKGKAQFEDIKLGLKDLIHVVQEMKIQSIAVPPLGCGNGGLDWSVVKNLIVRAFSSLPKVQLCLYEPVGAPSATTMKIGTKQPNMTAGRAALIALLQAYVIPGYELTFLEIQKLMYFLQEVGEPLKLQFKKGQFGPYAENLHHVLQALEGHYIRGYGDRSRSALIRLLPDAIFDANQFLSSHSDTTQRIQQVTRLIDGFETPYGLELLSTVHWLAKEDRSIMDDADKAVTGVLNWNEHKRKTFRSDHIRTAWDRLRNEMWTPVG